jgi:hypothetical protein
MIEPEPGVGDHRDKARTAALYTTVAAGLIAACAPVVPASIRAFVIVAVGVAWVGSLIAALVLGARSYRQWLTDKSDLMFVVVGVVGIAVALISTTQLEIARVIHGRDGLIWHNDWRWSLTQAHSIARNNGLESGIDYAGFPIMYHVGPAWFAGAFGRVVGAGTPAILFGVMPAASTLGAAFGLYSIVRTMNLSVPLALFAAGTTLIFPWVPSHSPWADDLFTLHPDTWYYSASVMTNSNFALGVVFTSVALLLRRKRTEAALGAAGLATLVALKPQYFVSTGAFLAVAAISALLSTWRFRIAVVRKVGVGLPAIVFVLCAALPFTPFGTVRLVGLSALAAIVVVSYLVYSPPKTPRSATLLLAGVGALALSTVIGKFLPSMPNPARGAGLEFSVFGEMSPEYGISFSLVFVLACVALRASTSDAPPGHAPFQFARQVMVGMALFIAVNAIVDIIPDPASEETLMAFVGEYAAEDIGHWKSVLNVNLEIFTLPPLRLLLALGSIAVIASAAVTWRRPIGRHLLLGTAFCAAVLPLLPVLPALADPMKGYEVVDDTDRWKTLEAIPVEGSLVLTNDLADPDENYRRAGQGGLHTAYFGHSFYVSELANHFLYPEALDRMHRIHSFFGTPWSPAHERWLQEIGVTHLMVHSRCPPVWEQEHDLPLELVARHGNWTAYRIVRRAVAPGPPLTTIKWSQQAQHKWGDRECVGI